MSEIVVKKVTSKQIILGVGEIDLIFSVIMPRGVKLTGRINYTGQWSEGYIPSEAFKKAYRQAFAISKRLSR